MQANIITKSKQYLYIAMKTFYDPSGRSSGPKNEFGWQIDASMTKQQR
jgi:hypothetical protein